MVNSQYVKFIDLGNADSNSVYLSNKKYKMSDKVKVQVLYSRESKKSYGLLVDLHFDKEGKRTGASRLEWFAMSLCELEEVEVPNQLAEYYLTAPKWLLDKKKVKYEKQ